MAFMFAPAEMARLAVVCRRSCGVIRGNVGSSFWHLMTALQTTRVLNEGAEDELSRHQKQVDPQACRNTALQWHTKETRGMEHCGHDEFWGYRQRWLSRR